jgi:deoxyribonuclease V
VGVKPVVVSVGHRTSLQQAVALVLAWSSFRFPEPLRQAHQLANAARRAGVRG